MTIQIQTQRLTDTILGIGNNIVGQIVVTSGGERVCTSPGQELFVLADMTVGTTTTAQTLYNPIPDCGCCGK